VHKLLPLLDFLNKHMIVSTYPANPQILVRCCVTHPSSFPQKKMNCVFISIMLDAGGMYSDA